MTLKNLLKDLSGAQGQGALHWARGNKGQTLKNLEFKCKERERKENLPPQYCPFLEMENWCYKIMESTGLGKTSKSILWPPKLDHHHQVPHPLISEHLQDLGLHLCPGQPLPRKNFFLKSNLNLPWYNLRPFLLILEGKRCQDSGKNINFHARSRDLCF